MTTTYTEHFRFGIPDFLSEPWHARWQQTVHEIDRALYAAIIAGIVDLWTNNTVYAVGDIVISPEDGTLWSVSVGHTSALSPTTFSQDRAAHPTYWITFPDGFQSEPSLITGATYIVTTETNVAISKVAPTTTGITLPSVASRGGRPIRIIDWSTGITDPTGHTITITPNGVEKIMQQATWQMFSNSVSLASGTLWPSITLNGWYSAP